MAPGVEACREAYRDLVRTARRCTRSADEARDLAQDALLVALARGIDDWASPSRRPWLRGVVRKRAAFLARGEVRRRRREELAGRAGPAAGTWTWQPRFLASLPRSLRVVAALISADLSAAEIRWLLGLSDTAWRKRLSELRRAVRAEPERPTLARAEPAASFGSHRPRLLASLRRHGGRTLATHDPDGHSLLLCVVPHAKPSPGNFRSRRPHDESKSEN